MQSFQSGPFLYQHETYYNIGLLKKTKQFGSRQHPLAYGDINRKWYTDSAYDGDFEHAAEKIEGVYGADEAEWEAAANKKLAKYGLKLGDFSGDRYMLVEA